MKIQTTRICPGEYMVKAGNARVFISRNTYWDGELWVASADWDKGIYTDPLPTLRDAKANAIEMIKEFLSK